MRRRRASDPTAPPGEYGLSIDALGGATARPAAADAGAPATAVAGASPDQGGGPRPLERGGRASASAVWSRLPDRRLRRRSLEVDALGRDPELERELLPLLDFLYRTWFRVEARGVEHLPASGGALLVANHGGPAATDAAMILHGVRRDHPAHRQVRPLLDEAVFRYPYLGTLMNRLGAARACRENAERLLGEGQLVLVFPEAKAGAVPPSPQRVERLGRGGFIRLALRADAPIVPTAIAADPPGQRLLTRRRGGAGGWPWRQLPAAFSWLGSLSLLPAPTRLRITYGPPIDLRARLASDGQLERALADPGHLAAQSAALSDEVRAVLQEMLDALRAESQKGGLDDS